MELSAIVATQQDPLAALPELLGMLEADTDVDEAVVVVDAPMGMEEDHVAESDVAVVHAPGSSLVEARNIGAGEASGDIYAFVDDDCLPSPRWGRLLKGHVEDGANAAGGPAMPAFPGSRPWYLPKLFDWLVGCGPYHETVTEVRNTYGCNIAFDAAIFDALGGFDERYGKGAELGQAEEAELAGRMKREYGSGTVYDPNAYVHHFIEEAELRPRALLSRAFEQGSAKANMGAGGSEAGFLGDALRRMLNPRDALPVSAYTAAVAAGYLAVKTGVAR